jgi:hypothetical protein
MRIPKQPKPLLLPLSPYLVDHQEISIGIDGASQVVARRLPV